MKKIYSILFVLLAGVMLFAGCQKKNQLSDNPSSLATVVSNGGSIVQKEDYIYFIGGYENSKDLTNPKENNVFGKVKTGAIYRAKIVGGEVQKDAELVVPKVVGFENGGFYIFGDYIYYATPNMGKDTTGHLMNLTVNLCRININGNKKTNTVLVEGISISDKGEWSAYYIDGNVYFVVYTGSSLVSVKALDKKGEKVVMATDVTSVSLPYCDIYSPANLENAPEFANKKELEKFNTWIYFTQSQPSDSEIKGNILSRVQIGKTNKEVIAKTNEKEFIYSIYAQRDGYLFYTKKDGSFEDSKALLYKSDITSDFDDEVKVCDMESSNIYILKDGIHNFVVTYEEEVMMSNYNGTLSVLANGSFTVLGSYGKYIYCYDKENKNLQRINAVDGNKEVLYTDGDNTLVTEGLLTVDQCDNYVMLYENTKNGKRSVVIDCSAEGINVLNFNY